MLEGSKVVLREIGDDDTANIVKWRNSVDVINNFFIQDVLTEEQHRFWLNNKVNTGMVSQFIIIDKETNVPVGSTFLRDIDPKNKKAEFGIFIGDSSSRGKGFGSEAAILITDFGFKQLHLNRVYLRVFAHNANAIKSYENAGFTCEGLLRQDIYTNDRFNDVIVMSKLKSKE
jgi:UDP-4-amino-4,6-dideoxy-N-acetyl-beta-L-altrosamine N-acetyltransferase